MTTSTPFDAGASGDGHPLHAPGSSTATRVRRRRRPSGEPPPLPRQLHASGKREVTFAQPQPRTGQMQRHKR